MKTLMTLGVLGLFSAAIVGCEASASVGDPDNDVKSSKTTIKKDGDSYERKTTVEKEDGTRRVETRSVDRD